MDRAQRISTNPQRAGAVVDSAARSSAAAPLADHRPAAVAQRALIDGVRTGPAMVAQRRSLEAAFGRAAQFKSDATVAQRAGPEDELQMKLAPGVAQLEGEDEEKLQMKADPAVAQLEGMDEEKLQMKADPAVAQLEGEDEEKLQMKRSGTATVQRQAEAAKDGGLPGGLRAGVEALSGVSMDGVKVHYNSSQPAQLNALAYAQGSDIHLAPGQEQHLPHEAWHIAQQAQGRVNPTVQMKAGVPVNDDPSLEIEADVMGARAAAHVPDAAVAAGA